MNLKLLISCGVAALATSAAAQDSNALAVDGEALLTETAAPSHMENVDTIYSGWRFRASETQALQSDDFDNPGMIFVDQAIDLWAKVDGSEGKSCASCHENVEDFAGLRPTLPRVEDGELVTMENMINECRTDRMGAEPWKWSKGKMTAMTALIGLQSRGMPVNVAIEDSTSPVAASRLAAGAFFR